MVVVPVVLVDLQILLQVLMLVVLVSIFRHYHIIIFQEMLERIMLVVAAVLIMEPPRR